MMKVEFLRFLKKTTLLIVQKKITKLPLISHGKAERVYFIF
jgi:hypothetical protein